MRVGTEQGSTPISHATVSVVTKYSAVPPVAGPAGGQVPDAAVLPVCPHFHRAVELVGARWSGVLLRAMFLGCRRFSELRAAAPGISDTMLNQRLHELESAGVVRRDVYPTTPVRVEYRLTDQGRDLEPVLDALVAWAHRWAAPERGSAEESAGVRRS